MQNDEFKSLEEKLQASVSFADRHAPQTFQEARQAALPPKKPHWRRPYMMVAVVMAIGAIGATIWWPHQDKTVEQTGGDATPASVHIAKTKTGPKLSWQTPYKDLGNLKLLSGSFNNEKYFHYYQVGTTSKGDAVILVGSSTFASASALNSLFTDIGYMMKQDDKYVFLKQHVSDIYRLQSQDNSTAELKLAKNVTTDEATLLPDLKLADEITLADKNKTVLEKTSANVLGDLSFPGGRTGLSEQKAENGTVGKVFLETIRGTGYTSPDYLVNRPDMRTATYRVKLDLTYNNGVPNITWSDGSKNTTRYLQDQAPQCGNTAGNVVAQYVYPNQLDEVGKADNDRPVYRFKNAYTTLQYQYFKADSDRRYDKKPSAADFLKDNNVLLIQDGLNQYNALVKADLPIAKC